MVSLARKGEQRSHHPWRRPGENESQSTIPTTPKFNPAAVKVPNNDASDAEEENKCCRKGKDGVSRKQWTSSSSGQRSHSTTSLLLPLYLTLLLCAVATPAKSQQSTGKGSSSTEHSSPKHKYQITSGCKNHSCHERTRSTLNTLNASLGPEN